MSWEAGGKGGGIAVRLRLFGMFVFVEVWVCVEGGERMVKEPMLGVFLGLFRDWEG